MNSSECRNFDRFNPGTTLLNRSFLLSSNDVTIILTASKTDQCCAGTNTQLQKRKNCSVCSVRVCGKYANSKRRETSTPGQAFHQFHRRNPSHEAEVSRDHPAAPSGFTKRSFVREAEFSHRGRNNCCRQQHRILRFNQLADEGARRTAATSGSRETILKFSCISLHLVISCKLLSFQFGLFEVISGTTVGAVSLGATRSTIPRRLSECIDPDVFG